MYDNRFLKIVYHKYRPRWTCSE